MSLFDSNGANTDQDNFVGHDDVSQQDLETSLTVLTDFSELDLSNINNFPALIEATNGVARSIHKYLLVNPSKTFTGYGETIPKEVASEIDLDSRAFTLSLDVFVPHIGDLKTTHVFSGSTQVLHLDYVFVSRKGNSLNIEVYYNNFNSVVIPNSETMQIEAENKLLSISLPLDGIAPNVLDNPQSLFDRDKISITHTKYSIERSQEEFIAPTRYLNYRSNAENPDLINEFAQNLQKVVYLILNGTPLKLEL